MRRNFSWLPQQATLDLQAIKNASHNKKPREIKRGLFGGDQPDILPVITALSMALNNNKAHEKETALIAFYQKYVTLFEQTYYPKAVKAIISETQSAIDYELNKTTTLRAGDVLLKPNDKGLINKVIYKGQVQWQNDFVGDPALVHVGICVGDQGNLIVELGARGIVTSRLKIKHLDWVVFRFDQPEIGKLAADLASNLAGQTLQFKPNQHNKHYALDKAIASLVKPLFFSDKIDYQQKAYLEKQLASFNFGEAFFCSQFIVSVYNYAVLLLNKQNEDQVIWPIHAEADKVSPSVLHGLLSMSSHWQQIAKPIEKSAKVKNNASSISTTVCESRFNSKYFFDIDAWVLSLLNLDSNKPIRFVIEGLKNTQNKKAQLFIGEYELRAPSGKQAQSWRLIVHEGSAYHYQYGQAESVYTWSLEPQLAQDFIKHMKAAVIDGGRDWVIDQLTTVGIDTKKLENINNTTCICM
jgi:hypothetical protein